MQSTNSTRQSDECRSTAVQSATDHAMHVNPGGFPSTVSLRLSVAELVDDLGDPVRAENMLSDLRRQVGGDDDNRWRRNQVVAATTRFLDNHGRAADAVALLESPELAPEIRRNSAALQAEYAWALLLAGREAEGAAQMKIATFAEKTTASGAPHVYRPMDMAYAWHAAGQDDRIATLDRDAFGEDCREYLRLAPDNPYGPVFARPREAILRTFAQTKCADAGIGS